MNTFTALGAFLWFFLLISKLQNFKNSIIKLYKLHSFMDVNFLYSIMPLKLRKALELEHVTSFQYKDPVEQERMFNTPYLAPPPSANGIVKKGK